MSALAHVAAVLEWHARRASRWVWLKTGVVLPVAMLLVGGTAGMEWHQRQDFKRVALQAEIERINAAASQRRTAPPVRATAVDTLAKHLLEEPDAHAVLHDILKWAEDEKLSIERAEYAHQPDPSGQFARFRIVMPMRGESSGVQRLISKALRHHKALTLKSVRFVREHIETNRVEAQVEWVILLKSSVAATGVAK